MRTIRKLLATTHNFWTPETKIEPCSVENCFEIGKTELVSSEDDESYGFVVLCSNHLEELKTKNLCLKGSYQRAQVQTCGIL